MLDYVFTKMLIVYKLKYPTVSLTLSESTC